MIFLTFQADTPEALNAQLRQYLSADRPAEGRSEWASSARAQPAGSPTNDDYRRAIRAIPSGKVAPYSVVSEVVRGDSAGSQKVAGLAANDGALGTAYRVIKKDGSIAAGFRWADGRMGGPDEGRRKLEEEGVGFDNYGRALPQFVLAADELRTCYEVATEA